MSASDRAAARYLIPVAAGMATVAILNGLWSLPSLEFYMTVPHALGVYLPSALVALALLWWVLRQETVGRRDVGLDISGWTAPKRLLALVMILTAGYGSYTFLLPPQIVSPPTVEDTPNGASAPNADGMESITVDKPSWGDYCFWFVFLLSASLVEMLVFVCLGFSIPEKWLKKHTQLPGVACILLAALFAAFMFGIYHYTHEPRFWAYVYVPLMPVMLANIACFVATRNLQLTLVLHNSFAAFGFTQEQYLELASGTPAPEFTPAHYLNPDEPLLAVVIVSFVVPYLVLLWIEHRPGKRSPVADGSR